MGKPSTDKVLRHFGHTVIEYGVNEGGGEPTQAEFDAITKAAEAKGYKVSGTYRGAWDFPKATVTSVYFDKK